MIAAALQRLVERRRHHDGAHAALFVPAPAGEWIALDLETTGLDPRVDQILSIAAVPCIGNRIGLSRRLELTVRCDSRRIPDAIRYHRLRPLDVADGVPLDQALDRLLALIGSRPLVGYCIDFDIAMLDRALRPRLGFGLPNRRIDVQREYARWSFRRAPFAMADLRFEAIAGALGLDGFERHRALDDAVAAALMHLKMKSTGSTGSPASVRRIDVPVPVGAASAATGGPAVAAIGQITVAAEAAPTGTGA